MRSGPQAPRNVRAHGESRPAAPPPESEASGSRRRRLQRLAIAAIVAIAIGLRVWRIRHGLPDFTEEAIPFKRAFEMWGWDAGATDWNPHLFDYPSLSFYLHFFVQKLHFVVASLLGVYHGSGDYYLAFHTDPTPMVVIARMLGILADAVTVAAVAVIGERLTRGVGLLAAALVAISPTMILDGRSIYCDSLMTAFSLWAIERMLRHLETGRRRDLVASSILIGLAAGSKYPAGLLVVPLAWICWRRRGSSGLVRWVGASAGAFAVFLLTSPYIVLDFDQFASDFSLIGSMARAGHLGSLEHAGFVYYVGLLARSIGWPALVLLAGSLAITAIAIGRERAWSAPKRRAREKSSIVSRTDAQAVLWLALLAFGVPISLGRIEAERYLIPVVPLAALLAASACFGLIEHAPDRSRPLAWIASIALLIIPDAIPGFAAASSGGDTTQLAARRWFEDHLGENELVVQEAYGAALPTRSTVQELSRSRAFQDASAAARERFLARRVFRSVKLPLAVVGRAEVTLRWKGRAVTLRLFPHISDLNRIYYEPALFEGVDYFLSSRAVRGRFEADSARDSMQVAFYRRLDANADTAAVFRATRAIAGPTIVIYRLGDRAQRAFRARSGSLDPLWWAAHIPMEYRRQVQSMAPEEGDAAAASTRNPDGSFTAWMRSLRSLYVERIRDYAYQMSQNLYELGRNAEAERFAASILSVDPGDVPACGLFVACASRTGEWAAARSAMEAMLSVRDPSGRGLPGLRIEYAQILAQIGDREATRRQLELVLAASPASSPVVLRARTLLETLDVRAVSRSTMPR